MPHPIFQLKNVHASYGRKPMLKSISLEIAKGENIAIIGPSGGGKSTLLRVMNLLHKPTKGSVNFDGIEQFRDGVVLTDENTLRQKIGLIHQEWHLWPNRTVLRNIIDAPLCVLKTDKRTVTSDAYSWLDRFRMREYSMRYPHSLSGGQKQRIAIIRAMLMKPDVVLADEITSALDVDTTVRVFEELQELKADDTTFVYVTHHLAFAERVADRIIVLVDGEIVETGDPTEILHNPSSKEAQQFLKKLRYLQ